MSSLKEKAIGGFAWSAFGKISNTIISFVVGVVLARLLSPSDFGTIGMISIFISVSSTFVDSGFHMALVRKKDRTDADCSTVFYFNIGVAIVCYLILFILAPNIAVFFKIPILTDIVRVLSLILIISSLNAVQRSILISDVNFKRLSKVEVFCNIIGGVTAISMAFTGFGLWALVGQTLASGVMSCAFYWMLSSWRPKLLFSIDSFKDLFGFGSKMLGSKLLNTIIGNLTPMLIGRFYTAKDLGYYSKGSGTASIPSNFFLNVVISTSYPILSKLQDNDEHLVYVYRRYIKICSLVIFWGMCLLCFLGKPLMIFVYGEKWGPAVIFMQLFCFSQMFLHIQAINVNLLLAKGRSDLNLRIEIIKKIVYVSLLFMSIPLGPLAICIFSVVGSQISLIINTYYTKKLFNYGYMNQWRDFLPYLFMSCISCVPALFLVYSNVVPDWLTIFIGSLLSFSIYYSMLKYRKDDNLREVQQLFMRVLRKTNI